MTKEELSEFGAGIVVCLAKFSEHLQNDWERRAWIAIRWTKMTEKERAREISEANRFPVGDAAQRMSQVRSTFFMGARSGWSYEKQISHMIVMWMNGASDHFYDLDRERAPASLIELADLCLEIGHGFSSDKIWTEKTMNKIHELWKQSCLDVDNMLGVKADWGQW